MTKICVRKRGFTLAEVMIVLTVIGVLTAILLPVARQSMPDENLMKFKKAHNTLGTAIRELVTSNKYYSEGDLGKKANGDFVDSAKYLCETIGDVLNVKKLDCTETSQGNFMSACSGVPECVYRTDDDLRSTVDAACHLNATAIDKHIILQDGVIIYEPASKFHFGGMKADLMPSSTYTTGEDGRLLNSVDHNNFYRFYKFICIDIDGIPSGATHSNCINECPFGYGLRIDGKLLVGKRALEWLEKDVNEE